MKVVIISTHPIQYQVPWFQALSACQQVDLEVYYALVPDQNQQGVGFGLSFAWDIPMLEGYRWRVIPNKRTDPSLRGFFASSTPEIYSMLAKARPDAVIITGWHSLPLLQALWACLRLGIPRIVRGESNGMQKRPWRVRMLHQLLLSRWSAFLAIGKANREFYLQYGVPDERILSSPYFVDNRRFQHQFKELSHERPHFRVNWNIPESHTCFMYAGKLEPKKRIDDLLRALDKARKTTPGIHLLVVGTGELMDEARQLTRDLNLPVTFAGFLNQTEITRAYVAADCLVLPSDFGETWGLVVNEAMVCGVPAIVSDRVGCGPDLIEEGVTGAIFPCGDVDALAGRLVAFASDRDRLARMGQRAKELIKDYSVEHAVEGTLAAINYVISQHGIRRSKASSPAPVDQGAER
jgi:glycosyltransferase involved in cell wall biosynthesis